MTKKTIQQLGRMMMMLIQMLPRRVKAHKPYREKNRGKVLRKH
jgi:hypothetical protein